jgi:sulfoxide reductase heme-binding subunit YedZ
MTVAANVFVTSKAVWYVMRATGVVSLVLLTGVTALGIATVNRWRPGRLPRFVTVSLHRSLSLLAVVFLVGHIATALADPYAMVSLAAVFVPFVGAKGPLWVGLGALSLDLIAALVLSSLLRRRLGARAWRAIHWLAYLAWPLALAHGIGLGTDASMLWLRSLAAACLAVVLAAVVWRVRNASPAKHLGPRPAPAALATRPPSRAPKLGGRVPA